MPGLVGFYTFGEGRENWDASHFIRYGLSALQGRGQESVSLGAIAPGNALHTLGGKGGVEEFFRDNKASIPKGFIGIGQTSSYTDDYLIHVKAPYELVLALDGKTDLHENRGEASTQSNINAHQQDRRRILFCRPNSQTRTHHRKKPARSETPRNRERRL